MKTYRLIGLAVALATVARADPILLSDDFSSPTLNPTLWTTILPFGSSSVTVSGGEVTTSGRGILATNQSFTGPYVLNGVFTMNNDLEHFNIALRSDLGVFLPQYQERSGLIVTFVNDGNGISLQEFPDNPSSVNDWNQVATTPYNFITGQSYFFSIYDTGLTVSVSVNGVNQLSGSSTFSTGDKIALYSREFSNTSTSIDAVEIQSVPDAGITALYLGLALTGLFCARHRRRSI